MVAPMSTLSKSDAARIGLERETELERADRVRLLSEEQLKIIGDAMGYQENEHAKRLKLAIAQCPEASLYIGGFFSDSDRSRATAINQLHPEQLIGFEESHGFFDDDRLRQLLLNYRARFAATTLNPVELEHWQADCSERLNEESEATLWRTFKLFDEAMLNTDWSLGHSDLRTNLAQWRDRVTKYLANPIS